MANDEISPVDPNGMFGPNSYGNDLLMLNNTHAGELSWLEPDRFLKLVISAFFARRIGHGDALILAFDQDADYDSRDFLWFRSRYSRFIYVDRIVVAELARGRGHARRLYNDLFELASAMKHERVVCEVNLTPSNPVSDAFHAALEFVEVGKAIHSESKTVRYLSRSLVGL